MDLHKFINIFFAFYTLYNYICLHFNSTQLIMEDNTDPTKSNQDSSHPPVSHNKNNIDDDFYEFICNIKSRTELLEKFMLSQKVINNELKNKSDSSKLINQINELDKRQTQVLNDQLSVNNHLKKGYEQQQKSIEEHKKSIEEHKQIIKQQEDLIQQQAQLINEQSVSINNLSSTLFDHSHQIKILHSNSHTMISGVDKLHTFLLSNVKPVDVSMHQVSQQPDQGPNQPQSQQQSSHPQPHYHQHHQSQNQQQPQSQQQSSQQSHHQRSHSSSQSTISPSQGSSKSTDKPGTRQLYQPASQPTTTQLGPSKKNQPNGNSTEHKYYNDEEDMSLENDNMSETTITDIQHHKRKLNIDETDESPSTRKKEKVLYKTTCLYQYLLEQISKSSPPYSFSLASAWKTPEWAWRPAK